MSANANHDTPEQWTACSFWNPPAFWGTSAPPEPPLGHSVSSSEAHPEQLHSRLRSGNDLPQ